MSDDNLSLSRIPILSSKAQFLDWYSDVLSTAMLGGFSDALTGDNISLSKEDSEQDKVRQRELKAKGLILRTVSPLLRRDLLNLSTKEDEKKPATANELWEHIRTRFDNRNGSTPMFDFKNFLHMEFIDDGTMEAQFDKKVELRAICANNEFYVKDWQFAVMILLALPQKYQNITDSLLSAKPIKEQTYDEIRAKVLDQEARWRRISFKDKKPPTNVCVTECGGCLFS